VVIAAVCAAIRHWNIAQTPGDALNFDQLICGGKTLSGSIETMACASAFIALVMIYPTALA
jgi:hypothetical protein